ncbi:MAG: RusA family crossover junction endodeoxyribonuclease [Nitrososphaeria archaeon]
MEKIILNFPFRLITKDNAKMITKLGKRIVPPKFKAFEKSVSLAARQQYKRDVITDDLKMEIIAYYKDKKHSDCGNLSKSICDALEGIVYDNDRQIKDLRIRLTENSKNDSFKVIISRL